MIMRGFRDVVVHHEHAAALPIYSLQSLHFIDAKLEHKEQRLEDLRARQYWRNNSSNQAQESKQKMNLHANYEIRAFIGTPIGLVGLLQDRTIHD